jgi:hypothetical protein
VSVPLAIRCPQGPPLLAFLLLAAGCGESRGTLSGKVFYQGTALTEGQVSFFPETGPAVIAPIGADGSYTAKGLPVGPARVAVSPPRTATIEPMGPEIDRDKLMKMMRPGGTPPTWQVPDTYSSPEKSGMTCTVTGGAQEFDVKIP